jgi:hypothetical protein
VSPFRDDTDGKKIMWLVQRRERREFGELAEHRFVDEHRRGELRAAVHHAVTNREERVAAVPLEPLEQKLKCTGMLRRRAIDPCVLAHDPPVCVPGAKSSMPVKLFQVPADFRFEGIVDDDKLRKLEAG